MGTLDLIAVGVVLFLLGLLAGLWIAARKVVAAIRDVESILKSRGES